jgi:protocatechuate 3,4-dioxygenase beta subunit
MNSHISRRRFLNRIGITAASFASSQFLLQRGAFAEELIRTPRQTRGPFYPDHLPLDTDNDLIIVNDDTTRAVGEITHLTGKILDANGNPIRNALVEIWQADAHGVYLHSHSNNGSNRDRNFQGFGRFLTGSSGEYYFRTIKPVPYPGRTPHIHFAIKLKGQDEFATQCYIKNHPLNGRDFVLNSIRDDKARESVQVDFAPIPDSKIGELAAKFDVVMGAANVACSL